MRRFGLKRAQAICIGDEDRDAKAAAKAGIAFGAVTWGYSTPEALAAHGPARTFLAMPDILSILD